MKEDKSLSVTVRAKKIEDCTKAELNTMLPLLTDENGINYKQLSGMVPKPSINAAKAGEELKTVINNLKKPSRAERRKQTK